MVRYFQAFVIAWLVFLAQSVCSAQITATSINGQEVALSWSAATSKVTIAYRRVADTTWTGVTPAGAVISTPYGGIVSPGSGTVMLPTPGDYEFQLKECNVFPSGPMGSGLSLRCGSNQSYYGGTYNGAVVQSAVVSLHSPYEFTSPTVGSTTVASNQIKVVAANQYGKLQIDWKGSGVSFGFAEIGYRTQDSTTWTSISPGTNGFPSTTVSIPFSSATHSGIAPAGSITTSHTQSNVYVYRMRTCNFVSQTQGVPGTKQCGSYYESVSVQLEALNFSNLPPLVSIASPAANSQVTTGQAVAIKVSATDPEISGIANSSTQIARVEFYRTTVPGQVVGGASLVHTATTMTSGFYQYSFTPNAAGDYYIVAVATDTGGAKSHTVTTIRAVAPTSTPPQPNNTTPVNFSRYAIYYGDFDEDGNQDIYFHGRPLVIILHGEIATPITLAAPPGFAYFGKSDGSYAAALEWDMTDSAVSTCSGCRLANVGQDYVLGDMNNDGNLDMLVLGKDSSVSSLLISGTEGTALPQVLLEILSTGQTRRPGQAASTTPYFTDNLRGRSPTISSGKIIVDGVEQTLANLQQVNSTQGSALATNQSITAPEAPSLPSPTLNAADLAEIDTLSSIGGEFRVNESGAATYTVPIALPAGTAGVAPDLALSYSSQAGIGNMGLGWSLSAGSSISRCRQTLQVDGQAQPIQFNDNDRFCLDGQRLLLVSGADYGAVDAIYKPEIDNGVIVTSVGGTAGHPASFIVSAKDGSKSFYGVDANSKHSGYASATATSPQTDRILTWHISEFRDSADNKIVYAYDPSASYHRLTSISYGYGTGSVADVVVNFTYGPRRRADTYWVAGSRFSENSLLNTISVYDRNELVREYKVVYNAGIYESGADKADRVVRIKSCLGDQCSRPLSLDWGFASAGAAIRGNGKVNTYSGNIFATSGEFEASGNPAEKITVGGTSPATWSANDVYLSAGANNYWYWSHQEADINGDGRQDILLLEAYNPPSSDHYYKLYTLLQTDTGFAARVDVEKLPGNPDVAGGREAPQLQPVDLNADGRMDLVAYTPWDKKWRTYFSEPQLSGTWKLVPVPDFLPSAVNDTAAPVDNMRFADMNSDGLPDAVYTKNGSLYVHHLLRSNSEPATSPRAYYYKRLSADITTAAPSFDIYNFGGVADLNEDGRADILGSDIVLSSSSTSAGWSTTVMCSYTINFRSFLLSAGSNSFEGGSTTAVAQGAFPATQTSNEKIIAKCDLVEFRRRIYGPFIADINADGLVDMVWAFGIPRYYTWNDANRDPEYRTDIVRFKLGQPNQIPGARQTFGEEQTVTMNAEAEGGFELMDTDSDGDLDVVFSVWGGAKRISKWTGTSFSTTTSEIADSVRARYVDVNGDGYLDKSLADNNRLNVTLGVPTSNNAVTRFETGMGAVTSVFYEPLRDSGRYTKMGGISNVQTGTSPGYTTCTSYGGSCFTVPPSPIMAVDASAFYQQINDPFAGVDDATNLGVAKSIPAQEIVGAMPVVTRVASSAPTADNPNALAGVDYSYEGLRIQAGGRGLLGFKKLTTTDMQTGIATTTEYRQDWPFLGSPLKTVTKTRYGNVLKESTSNMAIVGIDASNIVAKRTQAQQGTANLGPLVLYTKEARDVTYDVPSEKLAMPTGPATADATAYDKLSEVVTTMEMDKQGNVTRMVVQTLNGAGAILQTQTTVNNYLPGTALPPDATNHDGARFGRLSKATVTTTRPGLTDQTRVADFAYYGYSGASCAGDSKLRGLLCMEKVTVSNLGGSDAPEITQHFYDAFGNKIVARTGTRVSPLAEYDTKGRYVQATYDVFRAEAGGGASVYPISLPAGASAVKTSEVLTRDKFGNALLSRAAIGSGNWLYSVQAATPMGAIYFKGDSAGAFEESRMQRTLLTNANWCPLGTKYVSTVTKSGGAKGTQCFDRVGRDIGGYVVGFSGEIIRTRKDYDVLGRVIKVFEPAKNAAPSLFTSTEYDVLGRPITVTHPFYRTDIAGVKSTSQIAKTRFEYAGFDTKTIVSGHTDDGVVDRTKEEFRNALGELTKVTEMGSRSIDYQYDVLGNLTKTIDPAGNEVVIGYNGLGQKVSMNDPDKGVWTYRYNAFGEITTQIDAAGTNTITTYDFKGRKETQTLWSSGAANDEYFLTWEYDLAENGLGQVFRESKSNADTFAREFTRTVTFDSFGRPSVTTTTFQGAGTTQESHYQKVVYDKFGRVHQIFDAARAGPQFTYNGVQNLYNEYGYLAKVQDAANGGSVPFYTVNAMDARGNVVDMTYGSGDRITYMYDARTGFLEEIKRQLNSEQTSVKYYNATWDHLGNLVKRDQDFLGDLPETFAYDNYNRLVSNKLNGTTKSVFYNNIDNITGKTEETGNTLIPYTYHSTKKHAVTKVGNRSFEYDANGNVTRELAGTATRKNFTYTLNDLVKKIEVVGADAHTSEFFYDSAGSRYKRIDRDSSDRVTTTLYLGNVEKIHNSDGSVQWKRQIGGVAQVTHAVTASSIGTGTRRYFHMDHLGSINVITNSSGVIEQQMAFDPWGARRTVNSSGVWQASNMTHASILSSYAKTAKPATNRGYTGHEMLDEVGIIHMNGRIYDAYLARFLQADPYIQAPTFVASLNRYSYVLNNPLNAVDPTGYFSLRPFANEKSILNEAKREHRRNLGDMIHVFGVQTVSFVGNLATMGCGIFVAVCAAGFSYDMARVQGGTSAQARKAGAIAGVSAFAFQMIGSYYKTQGIANAGRSGLTNFGGNMLTTGQIAGQIAAHAVVGGVSSYLQGGKFGHGFISAGFTKGLTPAFTGIGGGSFNVGHVNVAEAMIAGMLGGTISQATGGKFASGFLTATFGNLFNQQLSNWRAQQARKSFESRYGAILKRGVIDIDQNMSDASQMDPVKFVGYVETGGNWDYKNNSHMRAGVGLGLYSSDLLQEFGNVHFGIVANSANFTLTEAVSFAGGYQALFQDGGSFSGAIGGAGALYFSGWTSSDVLTRNLINRGFSFGDNPGDSANIMWGYDHANYIR